MHINHKGDLIQSIAQAISSESSEKLKAAEFWSVVFDGSEEITVAQHIGVGAHGHSCSQRWSLQWGRSQIVSDGGNQGFPCAYSVYRPHPQTATSQLIAWLRTVRHLIAHVVP